VPTSGGVRWFPVAMGWVWAHSRAQPPTTGDRMIGLLSGSQFESSSRIQGIHEDELVPRLTDLNQCS
jgi:hypothetical protein